MIHPCKTERKIVYLHNLNVKQKTNNMKKVVSDFIKKEFACETGYSGSQRIMYIKGDRNQDALRAVREKWPTLVFYVRAVDAIPKEALEVYSGPEMSTEVAAN